MTKMFCLRNKKPVRKGDMLSTCKCLFNYSGLISQTGLEKKIQGLIGKIIITGLWMGYNFHFITNILYD